MTRKTMDRIYICGGDDRPGPRDSDCPSELHDWPLPSGYVDASEMAMHRLYAKWINRRCPDCGLYGWIPGRDADPANRRPFEGEKKP